MKKILVTGARTGVGLELAKRLLSEGHHVATLTRSELPDDPVVAAAREGGRLSSFSGDLADATSRARALAEIARAHDHLDVVFNVAGVSLGAPATTPQRREFHFEVNTLAPFVVLRELQPLLERGAGKLLVNVSSNAALTVKAFEPSLLARPTSFEKLFGPYARSKLALSLWTHAIAPRLGPRGVRIMSVCPGPNKTPMTAGDGMPWWLLLFRPFLFQHPRRGADALWRSAFDPPPAPSGVFVVKGRPTTIPFVERAADVLALVESMARQA